MSTTGSPGEPGSDDIVRKERAEAFALLAEIVGENHASGRRSYGASLKPELRRRTFGGFDERRLRFDSFRSFLRGAVDAGAVDIHPAPRGPDVVVATPGVAPIVDSPREQEPERIRKDLWDSFFDWDERYARAYDTERGQAIRYPAAPVPLEPPELADLRREITEQPDRFRQITPIPVTAQVEWMREFVESLGDGPARQQLEEALVGDRPERVFSNALASHSDARRKWSAFRLDRVEAEIRRWAATAGLDIEVFEPASTVDADGSEGPEGASGAGVEAEDERVRHVREHLKQVIDRMPASELERLPIPFGYTLDF